MNARVPDIDAYLALLPDAQRATLEQMRRTILTAAPDAVESISYGIPAFKYRGLLLVQFGAAKKHCALYGMSAVIAAHQDALAAYSTSKGTIRFPSDAPLPEALVQTLVRARLAEIDALTADGKR